MTLDHRYSAPSLRDAHWRGCWPRYAPCEAYVPHSMRPKRVCNALRAWGVFFTKYLNNSPIHRGTQAPARLTPPLLPPHFYPPLLPLPLTSTPHFHPPAHSAVPRTIIQPSIVLTMASYSQLQTSFTSTSFDNGPDSADSYGSGQFNYPQDPYYASYTAANEIKDSHQRPYSNQNAQQQQHAAWPVRDDHYPPFSNQLPASTHDRTYNEIPLINRSSSQDHRTSYPHDASTFSPFNPTPSSQPAPLHLSAYAIRQPHPPALDPAYSTFLDSRYARDGGYVNAHRLEAPHPNYPSTPINVVPNTSYATSRSIPPNDPSHLSTNQGPNAENVTICEWEGCGRALDDDTCRGVRSHLKQYHCNGISPAAGTMLRCMWGGRCRREPMKWENMPKHVAECHTKSMMRVCDYCRVSFSRGDALKRHLEAGNCASGPRIG